MAPDDLHRWAELLSDEQQQHLKWLHNHRCLVEVTRAPADPLQDLPEGYVIEVKVDRHALIRTRGTDIPGMFDYIFNAAKNLFDYVEQYDSAWKGSESLSDEPSQDRRSSNQ